MKTFNVYDEVWVMRNNEPTKLVVFAVIRSMSYNKQSIDVSYKLVESHVGAGWGNMHEGEKYPDNKVFSTKKELIDSLY